MKWYRSLYVGKTAAKDKYKIIGKIKWHKPQLDAYVITLASNPANLLDIYSANNLLFKYVRKQDMLIVGIARGYEEALEEVMHIIMDVYTETGGFSVRDYILSKAEKKAEYEKEQ